MIQSSTFVTLSRDVDGLLIPSGTPLALPSGMVVQITQALGNSVTLYANGNLIRLYGKDADAVGLNLESLLPIPTDFNGELNESLVMQALRSVYDPEIPVNIVDLGLIYDCIIKKDDDAQYRLNIIMTLTAAGCGMGPVLAQEVEKLCQSLPLVKDVHIDVVFDPPWNQEMMTEEARLTLGLI